MQHLAINRKKSQRSKRQPEDETKCHSDRSAQLDCVESGSTITSYAPSDRRTMKSQRIAPLAIRVDHPQSSFVVSAACSDQAPVNIAHAETMMIGVALGSPGKSLTPHFSPEQTMSPSRQPIHTSPVWSDKDAFRPIRSRWKVFGGLFSKRPETSQSPPPPSPNQLHQPNTLAPSPEAQRKLRRPQPSVATPDLKDVDAAFVRDGCPRDWIGPEQLLSPQKCKDPSYRRKKSLRRHNFERKHAKDGKRHEWPEARRVRSHLKGDSKYPNEETENKSFSREASLGASLLQVEIPSVELERYSVMFSNLLHPSQQSNSSCQPSPNRQPSLLARRQANLQELHTGLKTSFEPPRMHGEHLWGSRTASPNKSPSFSLFPPSSPTAGGRKYHGQMRERSPLQRSTTAPSPSKAKFDFSGIGDQQDQVIVIVHTPTEQVNARQRSTSDDAFRRVPSQKTTASEDTFITAHASPPHSVAPSSLPAYSRNSYPQRVVEGENPLDEDIPKAAEISIARQISISRRQRQLLVPAVPRVAPQPVQPKVVDVHQGRRLRKSHHLILEDA